MTILEEIHRLIISDKTSVFYLNNNITLSNIESIQVSCINGYSNPNITYSDSILEINLDGLLPHTTVYYNETEFARLNEESDINSIVKNIAILRYKNDKLLIYDKSSNNSPGDYFVLNQIAYNQFVQLLKSNLFADDYNNISRQLLLYSLDKGVYKIKIPSPAPILDDKSNFYELVNLFSIKYKSTDFILHFKNQIYNLPVIAENNRIEYIVTVLSELIHDADVEYQLFSKKFSFKKLRTELRAEKETYFKSLTEVLSKITTQIISVPISISAAVLASYKSEGWLQILILIVFWGYTFFVLKIHGMYLNDVTDLERTLEKDFEIINRDSGYNQEDVNKEKQSVQTRIDNIKSVICLFKISFIIIAITLTGYIIWKLCNEGNGTQSVFSHGLLAYFQNQIR